VKVKNKGQKEVKIKEHRPLAGKEKNFPKRESVERLVSLFRSFQERMNDVRCHWR